MKLTNSVPARLLALALLASAVLVVRPVAMQPSPRVPLDVVTVNGRAAVAGEVLVKFRRSLAAFERQRMDEDTGADRNDAIGSTGFRRMHSKRFDTAKLLAFLKAHPDVEYVEPNYVIQADAVTPNDPWFGDLWGLRNIAQLVGT